MIFIVSLFFPSVPLPLSPLLAVPSLNSSLVPRSVKSVRGQERIIERLKEQREREEREKGEEMESSKKELKDLREKVSQLQADLADREVEDSLKESTNTHTHTHLSHKSEKHTLSPRPLCVPFKKT